MIALTPKARFQKSESAKFYVEVVVRPEFHEGVQAALASYALEFGVTEERLKGAAEMIDRILNVAEPPEIRHSEALDHNLWPNQAQSQPLPRHQLLEKAKLPRPAR